MTETDTDCPGSTGIAFHDEVADTSTEMNSKNVDPRVNYDNLPWWFPKFRGVPVFYGNVEALGWGLEAIGRAIATISGTAFLGTAWLNLVKEAAGCEVADNPDDMKINDCQGTVYGFRPSSFLTMYAIMMGVGASLLMPLIGALADYTRHRRLMGKVTSTLICLMLIPTILIRFIPWEASGFAFVVMAFMGWAETVVSNAYLPELTDDEDILNYYTKMFVVLPFGSVICFLMGVLGIAYLGGFHHDDIALCEFAQSVSLVVSIICLGFSWGFMLKDRPPANQVPEGKSMWTQGFVQIYHTTIKIFKNYHALKWFYISIALGEAGILAFATIAVTYQTDRLGFSSIENGTAVLLAMIATVPGAFLGSLCTKYWNPIRSSMVSIVIIIIVVACYSLFLSSKGHVIRAYLILMGYGVSTGWKWTNDKMIASIIIPQGQDAELMGFFSCAGLVLTWFPPIIYTIMNENHISERIGIAVVNVYFVLAVITYWMMGDYRVAIKLANRNPSTTTEAKDGSLIEEENSSKETADGLVDESAVNDLSSPSSQDIEGQVNREEFGNGQ